MSSLSIASYFPWSRMVVESQSVSAKGDLAVIDLRPDQRFAPRCHVCGAQASRVCSHEVRAVHDKPLASARVMLRLAYRNVYCANCGRVVVEQLEAVEPWQRLTRRLAFYIHQLCRLMTVREVAEHLELDWKTVKNIDKAFLEGTYAEPELGEPRILAVDEFSLRKGRRYVTVVIDYQSGRILHVAEGNRSESLGSFFEALSEEQKGKIEAIAMDMWDPYIKAVRQNAPHVKIVFDMFHALKAFSRIIEEVHLAEYRKAQGEGKEVLKGSKWLLLKGPQGLKEPEQEQLERLLQLNGNIAKVMILREKLKGLWQQLCPLLAAEAIREWCALARSLPYGKLQTFAGRLERYGYGIINHCDYLIHTSKMEGVNNKIKVIKRRAYGYHDLRYFALKIYQAFDPDQPYPPESYSLFGR
jgi:transposase